MRVLRIEGNFELGTISRVDDWVRRVQNALMDDDPELYRLDEPVHQWSYHHIYEHLRLAVDQVNAFPPRVTGYGFEDLPNDYFAIGGARVEALYARARLEKASEMDYADGHSLNVKRGEFYKQLADTLYGQWRALVIDWKKATPPTSIGLRGQQLPFRISRVLGLLPNFRSLFSG